MQQPFKWYKQFEIVWQYNTFIFVQNYIKQPNNFEKHILKNDKKQKANSKRFVSLRFQYVTFALHSKQQKMTQLINGKLTENN